MAACTFNGVWLFSQNNGTFNNPCSGVIEPADAAVTRKPPRHRVIEREPDEGDVELLLLSVR